MKLWNTTLIPIVEARIQECVEIKQYITQKIQNNIDFEDNLDDFTTNMLIEHESTFGEGSVSTKKSARTGSGSSRHSRMTRLTSSFVTDGGIENFLSDDSFEPTFKSLPKLSIKNVPNIPLKILENSKKMKEKIVLMNKKGDHRKNKGVTRSSIGSIGSMGLIDYNQSMARSDLTLTERSDYSTARSGYKLALTTSTKLKLQQSQFPSPVFG